VTTFLNVVAIIAGLVGAAVLVLYFLGPRD
jgi:hypothetical protein